MYSPKRIIWKCPDALISFCMGLIAMSLLACQQAKTTTNEPSEQESTALLVEIANNAKATITDQTERSRAPSSDLLISSRYTLSAAEIDALRISENLDGSHGIATVDAIVCTVRNLELVNEKNQTLHLKEGEQPYVQRFGLWEYDGALCQNVGISLPLDGYFKTLKGEVHLLLQLDAGPEQSVKVAVDVSIQDPDGPQEK